MVHKEPHYIKEAFTENEIRLLVNHIEQSKEYLHNLSGSFLRMRDKTILLFACFTGLRPAEILNLKWNDVDLTEKKIYVRPENNHARETLPAILPNKAEKILSDYKEIFDQYIKSPYVFPSLITFEPLELSSYNKRLLRWQKAIGIHRIRYVTVDGQPISAKTFYSTRKFYGTQLYVKTKNPYVVMRGLRHRNIASQAPYVLISTESIKEDIDKIL